MRKAILIAVALCAAPAHSRVLDFHTDIRVAKSGELTVTERLTLEVDDRQPHSILLRELPAAANVVDVIRNGYPEPYTAEPLPERLRLRVGGAPLDHGRHLYQITYRAPREYPRERGLDELAWRLDGGGFGVERVTAEVTLPATVPARDIRVEAAKDQQSFVRDSRAAFRSTRPLAPQEAMIVLVGLALAALVLYYLKKGSEQISGNADDRSPGD